MASETNPTSKFTALYGGSFDPPHLGHAHVIQAALASKQVSEIIMIPSSDGRWDKKPLTTFKDRLAMVELFKEDLFPDEPRLSIFDGQGRLEALRNSYAFETIQFLSERAPGKRFAWIIGEDNLPTLHRWHRSHELFNLTTFLVVRRPKTLDLQANEITPAKVVYLDTEILNPISSSEIRHKLISGENIFSLVSPSVLGYITSSKLYFEKKI